MTAVASGAWRYVIRKFYINDSFANVRIKIKMIAELVSEMATHCTALLLG